MEEFVGYGYFFLSAFLVYFLYGYIYHLYRSEQTGRRDFEKYGNLALDDDITSSPIEPVKNKKIKEEGKHE